MPDIASTLDQSMRIFAALIFSSTAPSVSPTAVASTRPRATGIAVCHSTDRLSVRRRVPKATSDDSSFLRSRNCSSCDTSRLAPMSISTQAAPMNSPVRIERSCRDCSLPASENTSDSGSIRATVFRTYSVASGTAGSSVMYAFWVSPFAACAGSAPEVNSSPSRAYPVGSLRWAADFTPAGTFHAVGAVGEAAYVGLR